MQGGDSTSSNKQWNSQCTQGKAKRICLRTVYKVCKKQKPVFFTFAIERKGLTFLRLYRLQKSHFRCVDRKYNRSLVLNTLSWTYLLQNLVDLFEKICMKPSGYVSPELV